ncbi:MAG: hypothetical protein SPD42_01585, partial [Eubacteriales bacterium]|nr:hypothetical protein [Eubacteriales bacterium]
FFPTALFHLPFYYCYDLPTSRFSATPKKITSINACYWAYRLIIVWGQIGLCRRQKFAPLTELGARFTPSSFLPLYFISLFITATACPLLALPPRQKK